MIEIDIQADSQEEYNEKKDRIVRAFIGKNPLSPKRSNFKFQNDNFDLLNNRFKRCIEDIKSEIDIILLKYEGD